MKFHSQNFSEGVDVLEPRAIFELVPICSSLQSFVLII